MSSSRVTRRRYSPSSPLKASSNWPLPLPLLNFGLVVYSSASTDLNFSAEPVQVEVVFSFAASQLLRAVGHLNIAAMSVGRVLRKDVWRWRIGFWICCI